MSHGRRTRGNPKPRVEAEIPGEGAPATNPRVTQKDRDLTENCGRDKECTLLKREPLEPGLGHVEIKSGPMLSCLARGSCSD